MSRQRRRRRRGPVQEQGTRKTKLPFPLNLIFNVKAFYASFIIIMIASMAAVGLGVGASPNVTPPPIIDSTAAPSATPINEVFDGPSKVVDGTEPYKATLETNKGDIVIEFVTDAPEAVNSFAFLAAKNFFNDDAFYYVDHAYVAQSGDPNCRIESPTICTGFGDPGYTLPLELTAGGHGQWSVAMPSISQAGRVHGSQFRIYFQEDARLDGHETVFGTITEGQDILEGLSNLQICSALTQPTDVCVDEIPAGALIIQDVIVEPA